MNNPGKIDKPIKKGSEVRKKTTTRVSRVWDFPTVRNLRSNRFPASQENGVENLFTRVFELLMKKKYAEAEQVLDLELSLDPLSSEGILSWTELKLCQGELLAVMERVSPLARTYQTNAYYFLGHVLLLTDDWDFCNTHDLMRYDEYMALVAECGAGSSDVFAKMALASIRRRRWKPGMSYFIEAIKAKEKAHDGPADLLLLCERNECQLERYLDCLPLVDEEPDDEIFELIVKTVCILLIAYEDLGICEAWPVAVRLAKRCGVVASSWDNLSLVFEKWCPGWIQVQRIDGREPLVEARMGGLVASQLIC